MSQMLALKQFNAINGYYNYLMQKREQDKYVNTKRSKEEKQKIISQIKIKNKNLTKQIQTLVFHQRLSEQIKSKINTKIRKSIKLLPKSLNYRTAELYLKYQHLLKQSLTGLIRKGYDESLYDNLQKQFVNFRKQLRGEIKIVLNGRIIQNQTTEKQFNKLIYLGQLQQKIEKIIKEYQPPLCSHVKIKSQKVRTECFGMQSFRQNFVQNRSLRDKNCRLCVSYLNLLEQMYKQLDKFKQIIKGIMTFDIQLIKKQNQIQQISQKSATGTPFQRNQDKFFVKLSTRSSIYQFFMQMLETFQQLWKAGIWHNDISLRNIVEINQIMTLIDFKNAFLYFLNESCQSNGNKYTIMFWESYLQSKKKQEESSSNQKDPKQFLAFQNQIGSYQQKFKSQNKKWKDQTVQSFAEFMRKSLLVIQYQQLSTLLLHITFKEKYLLVKNEIQSKIINLNTQTQNEIIQTLKECASRYQQCYFQNQSDQTLMQIIAKLRLATQDDRTLVDDVFHQIIQILKKLRVELQKDKYISDNNEEINISTMESGISVISGGAGQIIEEKTQSAKQTTEESMQNEDSFQQTFKMLEEGHNTRVDIILEQ